ncbi:MAG: GDP-mannose 4,6-dehydratase [Candidatus Paceibacterota bacterium]
MIKNNPKILITGGLGFIFSHVTEYFVNKDWNVVVIDNESDGSHPEIINGTFKYYKMDVSDHNIINIILKESPEYVLHAAAISDVDFSIKNSFKTMSSNILGNLHVFEASKKLPNLVRLLYVSTDEIYGECGHKKKETEIIFPKNPYSCSKAVGSLLRIAYDNSFKELFDKTSETRFCNVFGPRQDKRKILPAIKESLDGKYSIPLHDGGTGYREYIYVKNIPPVIDLILNSDKGNRVFNVTLNNGYTVQELIEKAEEITGKKCLTHPSHREGMDLKYQMNATRLKRLGWKPLYTFKQGLKEYLLDK